MKKFVLPLALLSSISALTSCTSKTEAPVEVTPVPTAVETPVTPVMPATSEMISGETTSSSGVPSVPTTPPVTRTETVTYATPAGNDPVEFSVTLTDDVITKASITPKAINDASKTRQEAFKAELQTIVGKKVSDLDGITAIGGSSLTTGAFKRFVQAM